MVKFLPLLMVSVIVAVNLTGAIFVDWLSALQSLKPWQLLLGISVVLILNLVRFILWIWTHKRFPISKSYPLTAVFFPIIAVISTQMETSLTPAQWVGVVLITAGVFWISYFVPNAPDAEVSST